MIGGLEILQVVGIYWVAMNVVTFICYGVDKRKARRRRWRISEFTLLVMAAVGGAFGALMAMWAFRHKTRHWKFLLLVPLFLVAQLFGVWMLCLSK